MSKDKGMHETKNETHRCSLCGRFCALYEKAPEGESGDIYACSVCDLNPPDENEDE